MTLDPSIGSAWQTIEAGHQLPVLDIPITASVIVAGAIASRDFMPVHHDRAYAIEQGAPDIFMNILTSTGYVSRYVTDWAGPEAMLRKVSIRLGVPALPGTTLRFTGTVLRTRQLAGEGLVEVELRGATGLGDHVTGIVLLTLPVGESPERLTPPRGESPD